MKYQKSSNGVANGLKAMAVIIICAGILYSLYLGAALGEAKSYFSNEREFSWPIAIGGCIVSFVISYGLFVAAEVLDLLQTSCDLEYTILLHLRGEEETEAGTDSSAAADAGPVPPVSARTESSGKGTFSVPPSSVTAGSGTASGGFIQFCPHCGAKQSRPAAKCWHCGSTLSGR